MTDFLKCPGHLYTRNPCLSHCFCHSRAKHVYLAWSVQHGMFCVRAVGCIFQRWGQCHRSPDHPRPGWKCINEIPPRDTDAGRLRRLDITAVHLLRETHWRNQCPGWEWAPAGGIWSVYCRRKSRPMGWVVSRHRWCLLWAGAGDRSCSLGWSLLRSELAERSVRDWWELGSAFAERDRDWWGGVGGSGPDKRWRRRTEGRIGILARHGMFASFSDPLLHNHNQLAHASIAGESGKKKHGWFYLG